MKTIHVNLGGDVEEAAAVAVDFLEHGGVVVMPMDTSYGLAADATNQAAVEAIYEIKGRDQGQTPSVVVKDEVVARALGQFDERAEKLWAAFMPGSLTLIVPAQESHNLAPGVVSDLGVGLRQPKSSLTQLTAERLERPYTATSANRTGAPPAYSAEEFLDQLPDDVLPHLVVDGGDLPIRPTSTVVSVQGDKVEILREGAIPADEIRGCLR